MDEKRTVLLWLGGGQITDVNINFDKYDEVIFIDAIKHICWEIESFISQNNINGFVINSAISESAITATFNETSDSDYSFLEGYEVKKPNNVSVISSSTVQTMGFSDVLSLVDLATSNLSIVCSISSLSNIFCEHVLTNTEDGSVDEFFLLQRDHQDAVAIDDGLFKMIRSHFYIRKAPHKCASSSYFSHYCFSSAKLKATLRDETEKALRFENESLKSQLSQKEKEYDLLLTTFESFKSESTIQMHGLLQQTEVIQNTQVDILTKVSEALVEKIPSLQSQIKILVEDAKDSNASTIETIEQCVKTVLDKVEVATTQSNDILMSAIDTAASRSMEKLDSQEKTIKALTSTEVDILTKVSEAVVEKSRPLESQIKTLVEDAKDSNARTIATIERSMNTVLEKVEGATNQSNDSVTSAIDKAISQLIEKLESTENRTKALVSASHTNTIKQIEDYSSVRNFIDSGQKPLNFHGWPISPDIAVRIVTMLSTARYNGVLEFGSGTSTALIGRIIKRLIKDGVYEKPIPFFSFDHNEMYFERTKELLTAHEVSEFVTLNHCELVKENFNDTDFRYYDCRPAINRFGQLFKNIKPKFLVLVDGPPGATNPHARYPAFPIILQEINQSEFDLDFLVDDYNRREEKEVVEKWKLDAENAGLSSENEVVTSEKGFSIFSVRCNK